jgi:CRISPR-associated protein Csd2
MPLEISITRMAVTNERDVDKERTMGRKHIVPYGLYRAHGFVSAKLAEKTGFGDGDLDFLWQALATMFDHDRSAARGEMNARALIAFEHDSALGNAPAHKLFDLVKVERATAEDVPARAFEDYRITVDEHAVPEGVTIKRLI